MDGADGTSSTSGPSGRRPPGRPAVALMFAMVLAGLTPVLLDLGVQGAVEQHRIETAGRCVRSAQTDCVRLFQGVLDGPVSGGRGYRAWEVTTDRAGVLSIGLSTGDSKDVEEVAPQRVTAAVWDGDVVWVDTSLGRLRDWLHTYASAAVMLLFGITSGSLAVMLTRAAVVLRRRTGSWWSAAGPHEGVDTTGDTAGRVGLWGMILSFVGAWSVGLSDSLWGLVVPFVGAGLYLWHRAASSSPDDA